MRAPSSARRIEGYDGSMSITNPVSLTARLTAAARARENRRPDRLFEDPWAEALAGAEGFALMERLEQAALPAGATGARENPYIAIRSRFFDDFLVQQVTQSGARQIVAVAAGLDTRAFRLNWPSGTRFFELDRPEVLEAKREVLEREGARVRCERFAVGVDLTTAWSEALRGIGFDPTAPSVWLVEGLFPYLEESAAVAVLDQAAALATTGSRLGADVIGRSFLDSPWTRAYLQALEREGAAWKFGSDQPEAFLAAHGWRATTVRPGEQGASYGRWQYPVAPRGAPGIPSVFLVTAIRDSP
jgi:methyltransferase (TIGR00027 family)